MCLCKEKAYPSFTCNLLYDLSVFIQNKDYVHSNIVYLMDFRIRYRDLYYLLTILHNMVAKSIRKHSLPGIIENTSGNPGITKNSPGNPGISEKNSENPVFRPPLPLPLERFHCTLLISPSHQPPHMTSYVKVVLLQSYV